MISKLPKINNSIFSVMSRLSSEEKALNLSQGFPEFDCDKNLKKKVAKFMTEGHNQYAPMPGMPKLRKILCEKIDNLYGEKYDFDNNITITSGATQAIYTAISALVHPGDDVIVFDPAYDCYEPAITLNGGKTIHLELTFPDFALPWADIEASINDNTRLIIINSPHNPSGALISSQDLDKLGELCLQHDCLILSDEVYEHMTYDGSKHVSVLNHPVLMNRSLSTFSFGKTLHTTGWKLGYCVGPEYLMTEFKKVHQYLVFSCNTPFQLGIAEHLENANTYTGLNRFFEHKRDLFIEAIKNSKFKPLHCAGTYFILLDYSSISDLPDTEFAIYLTKVHKIASIPCSVFYNKKTDHKILRFCFAKNDDTLLKAAEILCQI